MSVRVSRVGGRNIVIIKNERDNTVAYLPPIRPKNKRALPKNDFDLMGKSIVGDLGFSELGNELLSMKKGNKG